MTVFLENPKSISISEGIKGVRILIVQQNGEPIEFVTFENKFDKI